MKGFRKIDFNTLRLDNTRRLYRACRQSWFERYTIRESLQHGRPVYCTRIAPGEHTFVTPSLINVMDYAGDFAAKISREDRFLPMTHNVIVLGIQAEPYRDRLSDSASNFPEGIAIEGPIDLADISVLFSNRVDRLDNALVAALSNLPNFPTLKEDFLWRKGDADLPEHNPGLVEGLRQNRERTIQTTLLRLQSHFADFNPSPVDFEKYLDALVSLLE